MTGVDLSFELQNIQNHKNGSNIFNIDKIFVIPHLAEFQRPFAHSLNALSCIRMFLGICRIDQ